MQRILPLLAIILLPLSIFAQVPQRMSYQAVIRNSSGALVTSKAVGMRVSILQGTANGTEVYKETYNPNPQTNANGLISIEIGGGVPATGTFAGINWANGPYFIKTETDPNGGTNYTITGASQLLSVPYALYAGNVINNGGGAILYLTGDITNAQAQAKIAAEYGLNTQEIRIEDCNALTSIDLSIIKEIPDIIFANNANLQSINISALETCSALEIDNCPKLNSLNVNSLKRVSKYVNINNSLLTSLNFIALVSLGSIFMDYNSAITSISFPILTKCRNIEIVQNPQLSTFAIPSLTNFVGDRVYLYENKLSSIQINTLLRTFVSISPALTRVGFGFSGQNPPAPPTGQGLTDKATLISRGNNVQTD